MLIANRGASSVEEDALALNECNRDLLQNCTRSGLAYLWIGSCGGVER